MPKSNFCQPKTDERLDFLREAVDGGMSRNKIKVKELSVKTGINKTPEKTVLYENLIKTCFQQKYGQKRFSDDAYVVANILAYFEPPKSISKKKRAEMLEGKIWPAKKSDSDNIAKVVLDALNGIAYHDDTQIIKLSVTKAYKEEAYLSVTLMELK